MTNNEKIEKTKNEINALEIQRDFVTDTVDRLFLCRQELNLRKEYSILLSKKRTLLLVLGISFAIFYLISLAICLPPYIVRGQKRKINEEKINLLLIEISCLENELRKRKVK